MKQRDQPKPPRTSFLEAVNADEPIVAVIRGHLFLENLLERAVWEALERPEAFMVEALSFPRRIELAVALGLVRPDLMRAFLLANSLRNQFAHDPDMELVARKAQGLLSALPEDIRAFAEQRGVPERTPLGNVRFFFAILAVHLEGTIRQLRDDKVRDRVLHEMVREALKDARGDPAFDARMNTRLEEAISKSRKERQSRGEL